MVRGQNNTRHMIVLSGTTKYDVKSINGKKRIIFNDGTWTSDVIDDHNIREARLSHKRGMALRQWKISLDSSFINNNVIKNPDNETFEVCFYADNIFNGGQNDNFERVFGVRPVDGVTTPMEFYNDLFKMADKNLNHAGMLVGDFTVSIDNSTISVTNEFTAKAYDPTITTLVISVSAASESAVVSSNTLTVSLTSTAKTVADLARVSAKYLDVTPNGTATTSTAVSALSTSNTLSGTPALVIKEVAKKVSDADIYNRTLPHGYNVIITCREPIAYSSSASAYWISGLSERDAAGNSGKYLKPTVYANRYNGVDIRDMEHFFSRSRADIYDMDMKPMLRTINSLNASMDAEYYVLDIKYYHADKGAFDYASEKELSIVSSTLGDFTTDTTGLMAKMGFSAPAGVTIGTGAGEAFYATSISIANAAGSVSSVSTPKNNAVVLALTKDVNQTNN